ncbi:hypothetical protein Pint_21739 [Pistacia integerrima]|uniref:Uncharacterized protein n=1 Tax=Pistacia integerrima TaxID=434235 RepID=A0ACC0XAB0_9ROSI|nr:hypothetical protein Pint_21739 [Pistacia integerrima]
MVEEGKLKDLPIQLVQGQSVVTAKTSEGFDSSSIAYSKQINELCSQGKYKGMQCAFLRKQNKRQFDIDSAAIEHRSDSTVGLLKILPVKLGWVDLDCTGTLRSEDIG